MCGINGFLLNNTKIKQVSAMLKSMNDLIIHRGPDDEGIHIESIKNKSFGIGMRRLSIIDLDSGDQPMFSDDMSIAIVFNGEIYNYKKIKENLIKQYGKNFKTTSDTEVILKSYEVHGVEAFKMFDGMFAFALIDKNLNKIFIARDFFGEKPLYYTKNTQGILWSSELKSIISVLNNKPKICKSSVSLYFQLTYIPAPYTVYENIFKLLPNHYLEIDISNSNITERIITKDQTINKSSDISFHNAKRITHDLVTESVLSRSIADVPISTFLSGGVDSSIVSLCLSKNLDSKLDTFSLGFDKKSFDETDKSDVVAKLIGSNHHKFIISTKSIEEEIDKVLLNFDEPFADSSALPTYLVSKYSAKKFKVALTGDGGDEVFGGYNKYYMQRINKNYTKIVPEFLHSKILKTTSILSSRTDKRGLRFKFRRLIKSIDYNNRFYLNIISLGFMKNELDKLFLNRNNLFDLEYTINNDLRSIKDFRNYDKNISLEGDMLVKVDRTSMLSSIECRAPYLNKKLWEFTNSLPDSYLINGWNKKYLLKESFKHYFPKNFLNKSKMGFTIPVGDWLRSILKNELLFYGDKEIIISQGLFSFDYINNMIKNHLNLKEDNTYRLWAFYCFQKWYFNSYMTK